MVGKIAAGTRDYVLTLVRCPPEVCTGQQIEKLCFVYRTGMSALFMSCLLQEGEDALQVRLVKSGAQPKKQKGGRPAAAESTAQVSVDKDWLLEHLFQVSRMLAGGIFLAAA